MLILVQDVVTFILYLVTTWKLSVIWLSAFFFPFWKQEFQKTLGGKQPVYDTTIRTGRALKEKTLLPDDTQKLDNLLGEVRDKWDTVCGKSVERWAWMSPSWVSVLSQKSPGDGTRVCKNDNDADVSVTVASWYFQLIEWWIMK